MHLGKITMIPQKCCQNSQYERLNIWENIGSVEEQPICLIRILVTGAESTTTVNKARHELSTHSRPLHWTAPCRKTKMNLKISSRQVASHPDLTLLPSGLPPSLHPPADPPLHPLLNWKAGLLESPRWTWTQTTPPTFLLTAHTCRQTHTHL